MSPLELSVRRVLNNDAVFYNLLVGSLSLTGLLFVYLWFDESGGTNAADEDEIKVLIHKGEMANLLPHWPRIGSYNLSSGWDDAKEVAFQEAVQKVAEEKLILTSYLTKEKGALYAVPGAYDTKVHSFVKVVDRTSKTIESIYKEKPISHQPTPEQLSDPKAAQEFCIEHAQSLLQDQEVKVDTEITKKLCVFSAHLIRFDNGVACYHVSISHALGDMCTYYRLMDQISALMMNKPVAPLQWLREPLTKVEIHPDHYSENDLSEFRPLQAMRGVLRRIWYKRAKRTTKFVILSRSKIEEKKVALLEQGTPYLTTNDIVMAAICEMAEPDNDGICMYMDARKLYKELSDDDAGSCLKQITFPRNIGTSPNEIRKISAKGYYYETDQVSGKALCQGREVTVSNWCSGSSNLPGVQTVCRLPSLNFTTGLPLDFAIIFPLNDECIGVSHNFVQTVSPDGSTLLEEIKM